MNAEGTSNAAITAEWSRMLRHFGFGDDKWPESLPRSGWKIVLHQWIDDNVDDICEQRPMHIMVSNW